MVIFIAWHFFGFIQNKRIILPLISSTCCCFCDIFDGNETEVVNEVVRITNEIRGESDTNLLTALQKATFFLMFE